MDKINVVILFSITVGFFFLIFSASSSHVVAFEDLSRNKSKSNNAPHIVVSHKDRASGDELVTLDASKSFDPDGDPIKFSWKKISSDHFNIILLNDQSAVASFVAPTVKNNFRVLFELKISDGNDNADSEQFDVIISKNTAVNKKQDQQVNEVPASVIKKDRAEKSKTKSLNLSSIDRGQVPRLYLMIIKPNWSKTQLNLQVLVTTKSKSMQAKTYELPVVLLLLCMEQF